MDSNIDMKAGPELSLVIPAHNEEGNVALLAEQVDAALVQQNVDLELILVDDGSTDDTRQAIERLMVEHDWIRLLWRDDCQGQSAAMGAGIAAATGAFTATLDADLQNDPSDLLPMLRKAQAGEADMVQGDRSGDRKDSAARRYASIIGRRARGLLLGDNVRDTGCSARVIRSDLAKQIPLQYKGMHRFVPVYTAALGGKVVEMPVNHRPRHAGVTKYGVGVITRGWNGLLDCFAVWWMRNRLRKTDAQPRVPAESARNEKAG